jgi:hypothetical protein
MIRRTRTTDRCCGSQASILSTQVTISQDSGVVRAAACRARPGGHGAGQDQLEEPGQPVAAAPGRRRSAAGRRRGRSPGARRARRVRTPRPAGCRPRPAAPGPRVQVHLTPPGRLLTAGHRVQVGPLRGWRPAARPRRPARCAGRRGPGPAPRGCRPERYCRACVCDLEHVFDSSRCQPTLTSPDTGVCGQLGCGGSRRRWRASSTIRWCGWLAPPEPTPTARPGAAPTVRRTSPRCCVFSAAATCNAIAWSRQSRPPGLAGAPPPPICAATPRRTRRTPGTRRRGWRGRTRCAWR